METVALFLQAKAMTYTPGPREFDIFGRSSFNRYYYAVYLEVRSMLGTINETWATAQHAKIPELLTVQVLKTIKRRRKRADRLDDNEASLICSRAAAAANDLADLMKEAYAVRVAADYSPDSQIEADVKGRFRLNFVTVTAAHDWLARSREQANRIKRAWKLLDD